MALLGVWPPKLYLVPEISRSSRSVGSPRPKEPQRLKRLECIEGECAFGVGQANAQVTTCRVQLTKLSTIHHQPHTYDEWRILVHCKV
jgi:hypothetical protein